MKQMTVDQCVEKLQKLQAEGLGKQPISLQYWNGPGRGHSFGQLTHITPSNYERMPGIIFSSTKVQQ